MLMEAPIESAMAAALVLFGMTYTARSVLNSLTARAKAKRDVVNTEDSAAA